jgi:hypothetical protein
LLGAAAALCERRGVRLTPYERDVVQHILSEARAQLGDETFTAASEQGRAMSPEQAVALALQGS